ncbi:MAG: ribose-5-phosphate isomerase A, partial [Desulfurococcales archaeon]|nr:ribose-5-phosphate isomerase A [Desulfurococcales archaeon]
MGSGSCDPRAVAAQGALDIISRIKPYLVGVGTSSTVAAFIEIASNRGFFKDKVLVASSIDTSMKLRSHVGVLADPSSVESLDVYVDGADEVDPMGRAIK